MSPLDLNVAAERCPWPRGCSPWRIRSSPTPPPRSHSRAKPIGCDASRRRSRRGWPRGGWRRFRCRSVGTKGCHESTEADGGVSMGMVGGSSPCSITGTIPYALSGSWKPGNGSAPSTVNGRSRLPCSGGKSRRQSGHHPSRTEPPRSISATRTVTAPPTRRTRSACSWHRRLPPRLETCLASRSVFPSRRAQ